MFTVGTWPMVPALTVTVVVSAVTAIVGTHVVARLVPDRILHLDNDVKGVVLSVVGVLYAVLLGFIAIGVWGRYDLAQTRTYDEASSLLLAYRSAGAFPSGELLRRQLRSYTDAIVSEEWPLMRRGLPSLETRAKIERVYAEATELRLATPAQQNVHQQLLHALSEALIDRDDRISMSARGLDPVVWAVLLLGAGLTILLSFTFGFSHAGVRPIVAGALGTTVGLVLYLTMSLDYPFRGGVHITPDAFVDLAPRYATIDGISHALGRTNLLVGGTNAKSFSRGSGSGSTGQRTSHPSYRR